MKTIIPRLMFAAAAAAAALCFDVPASWAYGNAPWCAVIETGDGDVQWDCQYNSVEECRPNVLAGNRGTCGLNPDWQGVPAPPRFAYHRHRKHSARH
jgi:hypothetical protein